MQEIANYYDVWEEDQGVVGKLTQEYLEHPGLFVIVVLGQAFLDLHRQVRQVADEYQDAYQVEDEDDSLRKYVVP